MTATLPASPELTDALINGVEESWDCGFLKDVLAGTSLGAVLPLMISELRRHRSSPSSAWRDIKDAPKEPVGIDLQIDWNIGEHGPYILIAFDREHYPSGEPASDGGPRNGIVGGGWKMTAPTMYSRHISSPYRSHRNDQARDDNHFDVSNRRRIRAAV